jgi:hypothetical protein
LSISLLVVVVLVDLAPPVVVVPVDTDQALAENNRVG